MMATVVVSSDRFVPTGPAVVPFDQDAERRKSRGSYGRRGGAARATATPVSVRSAARKIAE
jgi:hypothetical protein